MNINPSIFKAYDIRGIYPEEITPEAVYRIGRAFGQYIWITVLNKERDPVVAVNADARASSPELKAELLRGLLDEKCHVIDCGLGTTPLHYFAINHLKADGGVMVTASHNPAQYNGFKLSRRGAEPIGEGSGMEEIRNTVLRGIFPVPDTRGSVQEENLLTNYIDFLCSIVDISQIKKMSVVFDVGNGMTGLVLPTLLEHLPLESDILFGDVDMTFPNHEANPIKEETLDVLKRAVTETKADLGVAFDGDGDRVGFITNKGDMVPGDYVVAFLAEHMLAEHKGEEIVHDLVPRSSRIVPEVIARAGGKGIRSRVGHAFFKRAMRKEHALFGGEKSGHYYFREFFFADSALLTFLYVIHYLSQRNATLSECMTPYMKYASSGEINVTVVDKDKALDAVAAHYRDAKETEYIDGISVSYEDFWFNVRPSNTEPLLRISMEAKEKSVLEARLKEVVALVTK